MFKELNIWLAFLTSLGMLPKILITVIIIALTCLSLYAIWIYSPSDTAIKETTTETSLELPNLLIPGDVHAALENQNRYRAPTQIDLSSEWLTNFKSKTQYPIIAQGNFTPTSNGIAFFAIEKNTNKFKVFVLDEDEHGMPRLHDLYSGKVPQHHYVVTVKGDIKISRIIWKNGGPKTLHLERDAIQFGAFETAASVFYWSDENEKFMQQWISD